MKLKLSTMGVVLVGLVMLLALTLGYAIAVHATTEALKGPEGGTDPPAPQTVIDEPDPAGYQHPNITLQLKTIDKLGATEGHGILFPDRAGEVVTIPEDSEERLSWLVMNMKTNRVSVWIPNDDNSPTGATDSDEECQEYVDMECEGAGFITGKGDASVGPEDDDGCQTCMGQCSGGCNENGCPHSGITECD